MLQMDNVANTWLVLLIIFTGGLVMVKITEILKIPDVAAYLIYGILIGPCFLGWVSEPSQTLPNQFILTLGATLILFDGGRGAKFHILKEVWVSIGLLATLGVFITTFVTAGAAYYFLHLPWIISLLLAAVIASTDPATLIPVFKRIHIKERLQNTAVTESAFNDAIAAILTMTVLGIVMGQDQVFWWDPVMLFFKEAIIGLVVGCLVGVVAVAAVSQRRRGIFRDYASVTMLVAALASYAGSAMLGGSGFMSAFTAGVITGNAPYFSMPFSKHTGDNMENFSHSFTLLIRMMIFVLLGTQVDFSVVYQYLWPGLAVLVVFLFIARPLTVLASVLPDRRANWSWQEIGFLFWVRETGVIPAALSGLLLGVNAPYADVIAAVTFLAILFTVVLQASTTGALAKRLGLLRPHQHKTDTMI